MELRCLQRTGSDAPAVCTRHKSILKIAKLILVRLPNQMKSHFPLASERGRVTWEDCVFGCGQLVFRSGRTVGWSRPPRGFTVTAITRTGRASGWRSLFGLRSDQASPIGKISSTHSSAILAVVAICCAAFAWTSVGNGQDRSLTIEPMQSTIDPPLASFSNFCQHLPDVEQRLDASTEYSNAFDQDSNISRLMMQSDDSSSLNRLVSSESSGRTERSNAAQTVDWSKVPPITSVPRPGWFTLRPTGPGYYTLMDELNGNLRSKAPPAPFGLTSSNQTPSFDHDFRYLDKADNTYHTWSDSYKRLHPRDDLLFSTGGEMRYRFNNYGNTFLTGKNDKFDLTRLRAYGDLSYRDQYRAFVEMIDARTYDQDLPPGPSDATNTDLLNAFVELKLAEIAGTPLQIRGGRQEIVLGSQRLIASPDFSNTLRTYDGLRGYWHSQKWSVDSFWVRPVIPNANRFDSSDDKRGFSGLFATHRPDASTLIDLYLLNLDDTRTLTRGDTVTLGGRFAGDVDKRLLYDIEAATQVGSSRGRTINAQAATAGLGWHFADAPGNISLWAYYDYATGTRNPETQKPLEWTEPSINSFRPAIRISDTSTSSVVKTSATSISNWNRIRCRGSS